MRAVAPRAQGADPKTVQSFRYPPSVHGTWLGIAVFIGMFWDFMAVFIVSRLGAVCPCPPEPQVVEEIVQFIPQVLFSKFFIDCISDATPVTVHPDSSEDREGSTNAVP